MSASGANSDSTHALLAAPSTVTTFPSGRTCVFESEASRASSRLLLTWHVASLTASTSSSERAAPASPRSDRVASRVVTVPSAQRVAAAVTTTPSTTGAMSVVLNPTSTLTPEVFPTPYSAATGCSAMYRPATLNDSNMSCVSRSRSALDVNSGSVISAAPSSPSIQPHCL